MTGCLRNDILGELLANQSSFYRACSCCLQRCTGNHDAGGCASTIAIKRDNRRTTSYRIVRSFVSEFQVGTARAGRWKSETKLGDDFIWLKCSLEHPYKEIVGFYCAHAVGALHQDIRFERQDNARHIGGGVRVSNATTDGTTVAYLWIANQRCSLRQQCETAPEQTGVLDRVVGRHGTDSDRPVLFTNVGEAANLAEINEVAGLCQAQLHCGNQAMSTCQQLGFVTILLQKRDSLIHRLRWMVIKCCWNRHMYSPF